MNRRHFITLSGAASLAAVTASPSSVAAAESNSERQYLELRQFIIENETQKNLCDSFFKNAAIPAMSRLGIKPVGVFYPNEGLSPIYVLIPHSSLQSFATLHQRLSEDDTFLTAGSDFINAPASAPAFKRMEVQLMHAFAGMPKVETPAKSPGRVFQLRIYESPSVKTGLKKIEMFNDAGEIKLFRETGLNPVFFGESLAGTKLPNLTYMLGFESMEEQKAAWSKFVNHPEWKRISKLPEYADKAILSGITNLQLKAAPYSQV